MAKQLAFYFDASACAGCKACQVACQDKNNLPFAMRWRRVFQYGGGSWVADSSDRTLMLPNNIYVYSLSTACNHCENPACVSACPAGAMTKRADGVVLVNPDQCIGCRYCEWACPYGAPQFNEAKGVMTKCTFCEDLLAQGQNPACVDACVMRAIKFGELSELRAQYGNFMDMEPLPASRMTNPALVIKPHKNAQISGKGTGKILNEAEES
jgi:anaerobic dimethyl sulfoxide reductase subunit B